MKHGSLFAGIGGFDLGFERAGIETAVQVELDPYCLELLESKWPDVERIKDVKEIEGPELGSVDIISGGFPCQDVSIAGRREGLAGERSGLWFEFHRILEVAQPQWAVIENVRGLLSSNRGRDFAVILRGLEELGYCVAYRILDAQYFGVPQRRRREFIVGCLREWRSIQVLFESEGLPGDPPASKETGEEIAGAIISRAGTGGPDVDAMGAYIYQWASGRGDDLKDTAQSLRADAEANYQIIYENHPNDSRVTDPLSNRPYADRGPDSNLVAGSASPKWRSASGGPAGDEAHNLIAAPLRSRQHPHSMPGRGGEDDENLVFARNTGAGFYSEDEKGSIRAEQGGTSFDLLSQDGVRRLTPRECERLQGFPDDWTANFSDSRRYRMIGNAVAVPVAEWLGHRIVAASA